MDKVVSFTPGECPVEKRVEEKTEKFFTCNKKNKDAEVCPFIYEPKCAYLDESVTRCVKAPCAVDAQNACMACKIEGVTKFANGECPREHLKKVSFLA